jgi:uncharacterized protein
MHDHEMLDRLERGAFGYFVNELDPKNAPTHFPAGRPCQRGALRRTHAGPISSRARVLARRKGGSMASQTIGRFVWHDHLTKDPKAAVAFYSDVIGWKTEPFGKGDDYTIWVGSQGPLGGTTKLPDEAAKMGAPPQWMGHVGVRNVDETAARAKQLGGKILKAPTDIPEVGRFAVIADPQGAEVSIFEPKPSGSTTPHDETQEGEFCWNELMTSDQAGALRFYSELFGWKRMSDTDMGTRGTYIVFGDGEKPFGGIMTQPKGMPMPPMWVYYTETSDIEKAIGRATGRGATVMNGPMEVPGGGHVAQLMDPQGAMFALHEAAH